VKFSPRVIWFNSSDHTEGSEVLSRAGCIVEMSQVVGDPPQYQLSSSGDYDVVISGIPRHGIVEYLGFMARNTLRTPVIIYTGDTHCDMTIVDQQFDRVRSLISKHFPLSKNWVIDSTNSPTVLVDLVLRAAKKKSGFRPKFLMSPLGH